jgi:membrane protein
VRKSAEPTTAQRVTTRQITSRLPTLPEGTGRIARLRRRMMTRRLVSNYLRDDGDALATIIAFNALFSLIPFLLIVFTFVSLFVQSEAAQRQIEDLISTLLPATAITPVLDIVEGGRDNLGQLGLLTVLALLLGGARLINALDSAFARIYRSTPRSFFERRIVSTVMVPVFSLLMIAAAVASSFATVMVAIPDRLFDSGDSRWLSGLLTLLGSFSAAYAMAWVLYATIPGYRNRTLRFVSWPGALIAAFLFVLLSQLFPLYVALFGGFSIYGSALALAIILLFWLYLLGQIIVIGAEVNALASGRRDEPAIADDDDSEGSPS